ncbi:MAG: DNA replication protein [Afipia sp. 62-7]|nr:DNA replication protein [Afipia sp.]OJU14901.1 MAG: DNA replication protein [Afipia sp. 62-7]
MKPRKTRRIKSTSSAVSASSATPAVNEEIGAFRARHLDLSTRDLMTESGIAQVLVNDSESPLAWLARRKGRDGRTMIGPDQFIAGERLRADFTRAHLTPRVTSSWSGIGRTRGSGGSGSDMTDLIVASRQRVRLALEACGPEFSGLLLDVCCFLRGLEDVERARGWPPRSAKVVLQLALDRLARHYGLRTEGHDGPAAIRTWLADDAAFTP